MATWLGCIETAERSNTVAYVTVLRRSSGVGVPGVSEAAPLTIVILAIDGLQSLIHTSGLVDAVLSPSGFIEALVAIPDQRLYSGRRGQQAQATNA